MAKIGTAHLEIKPVVDEAALAAVADRIAEAVAEGVRRGMAQSGTTTINVSGDLSEDAASQITSIMRERQRLGLKGV